MQGTAGLDGGTGETLLSKDGIARGAEEVRFSDLEVVERRRNPVGRLLGLKGLYSVQWRPMTLEVRSGTGRVAGASDCAGGV